MDQTAATVDPTQSLLAQMAANAASVANNIVSAWGASQVAQYQPTQQVSYQQPPQTSTGFSLGGLSTSGLVVGVVVLLAVFAMKKAKG